MNFNVGDHAILTKHRYRTGNKNYLVKIENIGHNPMNGVYWADVTTVCNADTGKKRKSKETTNLENLKSLEEFIDSKYAWLKELGTYL